ncbi:type II toxin-antitoxin system RelE/ParE family toxin [Methylacidimicrobium tartarophylax]|uniref:mRNA interferase YafQ n=1 Tax=Methylacidimicrobium tartarophylax TaxID=1041768 RepID=A0A5E6MPE4_9BACT|nr:type II toxin-antitoxin system YafQ family toxin [Methylacidimicrobium tartarophylax]VVM07868.1 mRNA interferase YafQ [Methylacidimicrobium tartarophylax]
MRQILESGPFERDVAREAKGKHGKTLAAMLRPVLVALANDEPLEPLHREHALSGNWHGCRDCHVKPDAETLELLRLGSHSQLRL